MPLPFNPPPDLVGKFIEVEGIEGPAEVIAFEKQGWAAVSNVPRSRNTHRR